MPNSLKRMAVPLALVGLVVLTLASMISDRRSIREGGRDLPWWEGAALDTTTFFQKVVSIPIDGASGVYREYVDLRGTREENVRLRERHAELEEEVLQLREALVTSGHLQRIAEMRSDYEIPMLPSEVVGFDVGPAFRSVLMDRGRSDGVKPGQPVITFDGAVGLVTATSDGSSRTMLLLDPQSSVDAIVQRSRVRGLVMGQGTGTLEFEFATRASDVQPGDVIITSGLGGVYPKGLRLGSVDTVEEERGQLQRSATLRPAVDLSRLEQVFVLLWRAPSMELLYGDGGREVGLGGERMP